MDHECSTPQSMIGLCPTLFAYPIDGDGIEPVYQGCLSELGRIGRRPTNRAIRCGRSRTDGDRLPDFLLLSEGLSKHGIHSFGRSFLAVLGD